MTPTRMTHSALMAGEERQVGGQQEATLDRGTCDLSFVEGVGRRRRRVAWRSEGKGKVVRVVRVVRVLSGM